jgi:transcriptional regulator with XRE-family HTH domain
MNRAHDIAPAIRVSFGRVLNDVRRQRHLSQEALADAADVDRTYPSLLERGLRQPTLTMLILLGTALGVDPCEFIRPVMEHLVHNKLLPGRVGEVPPRR